MQIKYDQRSAAIAKDFARQIFDSLAGTKKRSFLSHHRAVIKFIEAAEDSLPEEDR